MDFNLEEMSNRILQWSNINSGTFNVSGLEKLSSIITQTFTKSLECESRVTVLPPFTLINQYGENEALPLGPLLSFRKRKSAPIQVLLVGHMDTVFDAKHSFQQAYRKDNNTLIGPGVADMKGGLCIMLEALKAFEKTQFAERLGWEVLINPDEEIGSPGSAPFLAEAAKRHNIGLVFEPAMDEHGTLAGERKGSAKFTVLVHGRAAHAGRDFHLGRNAIVALAKMLQSIDSLNGQRPELTLNIGYVFGGGSVNVVPHLAIARLDIRFRYSEDALWVQEELHKIIAAINETTNVTAEIVGGISRQPKEMTPQTLALYEMVAKLGQQYGQTVTWKSSGGCSDANNLSALKLPNVDTLGVIGGKIHSKEEFLTIDSLEPRVQLTLGILKHLSENGL